MNSPSFAIVPLSVQSVFELLRSTSRIAVLTGAGCSTESGIPDYRGPSGRWKTHKPVLYQEFLRSETARRRYWARSFRGWKRFDAAAPNRSHQKLAELESAGLLSPLITQNVDRLHRAAGHRDVIELHGHNEEVHCVECGRTQQRSEFQRRMELQNRDFVADILQILPDGDAELPDDAYSGFTLVACDHCSGILKPTVIFFGENVPRERVSQAMASVEESELLLVLGSSLHVWSGYRFALRARELGRPIVIVNQGETRADDMALLKLDRNCGEFLEEFVARQRASG